MPTGIIIKGIGGFYYVKANEKIYECKARGIFRKDKITPLPGDRVLISINDEDKLLGSINEILHRDIVLVRPAVANINQIIVVVAMKSPAPDLVLLDKLLITAELKKLSAVVCLNKIDLVSEGECLNISNSYSKAGYRVIMTSSKTYEGFREFSEVFRGRITVLAGQSGVGKSTILNTITDTLAMQTGDISRKIERGKHTTRHAELVELKTGGYIVDTPGFSTFELSDIGYEKIELLYPEFNSFQNKCKFTWCSHISEPECSVKEGLKNGLIDEGRYERYIQLYNTLKDNRDFKSKSSKIRRGSDKVERN